MNWKEDSRIIDEFPRYSVDRYGNVYNNKSGRKLKQCVSHNGYPLLEKPLRENNLKE